MKILFEKASLWVLSAFNSKVVSVSVARRFSLNAL
jgi:hypothetical protein